MARRTDLERAQMRSALAFLTPAVVLYATFVLVPVALTATLSFTYFDLNLGTFWVGLENYERLFTEKRALRIYRNTFVFTLFAVTLNVSVGLILALLLNRAMPNWLLYFFRLAFFLPVIIAGAFVAIVWSFFLGDELGVVNYYITRAGGSMIRWLTSGDYAMMSIIIFDVWKNTGFFMIILIAALQSVPQTIMDAATMDGARPWRRFWKVTFPYISPMVFFCVVYASIGALQVFESIVILTDGGPGDATRSMSIYIAEEAFNAFELGYASSIAVVLTVVIMIVTALQMIGSRYWVKV